jgi:hypothetical protein
MKVTQEMFRLINMEMLETSNGVAWTADITLNNKKVGWVEDDSKGVVPIYRFDTKEVRMQFEEWSKIFGFTEWLEIDVASAGLYRLSDIYAFEVEGVTV